MSIPKKAHYTTPPHTRARLDVMRATATNWKDREEVKRITAAFLAEDVDAFDPELARNLRAQFARLKGKP